MKALIAIVVVAASLPLAAAAAGEDGAPAPKQHRICRTVDRPGSHMGEHLCLTPEQWVEWAANRAGGVGSQARLGSGARPQVAFPAAAPPQIGGAPVK